MMWILETVAVAFGMYSALPVPRVEWTEKNMRFALCAFPLVGAACGLGLWAWAALCRAFALPQLLRGAGFCVLPALLTGGIHLDGYADAADALASHASPARRQEILRDPRCGAFAVIRLGIYFVCLYALCCVWEATGTALWCVGLCFVLSRALSGASLTLLPIAAQSSLGRAFASAADKKRVGIILSVVSALCLAGLLYYGGMRVLLLSGGALLLSVLRLLGAVRREFGGMSGDLAGWFLIKTEFWLLAAQVAAQLWERGL